MPVFLTDLFRYRQKISNFATTYYKRCLDIRHYGTKEYKETGYC